MFFIEYFMIRWQELTLDDGFLVMRQSNTGQNEVFLWFNQIWLKNSQKTKLISMNL
jgi:hypothetical protein